MIFRRADPGTTSKDYHSYKEPLRRDFLNRCAYCHRHEGHFGGEAAGQIDHFYPECLCKSTGQPELVYTYSNLFWSCGECNNTKWDTWPTEEEMALGKRLVDSSREDTQEHWQILTNGELEPLTKPGEYTIDVLALFRDDLVRWRRKTLETRQKVQRYEQLIQDPRLTDEDRDEYRYWYCEMMEFLDPYPFNRPPRRPRMGRKR